MLKFKGTALLFNNEHLYLLRPPYQRTLTWFCIVQFAQYLPVNEECSAVKWSEFSCIALLGDICAVGVLGRLLAPADAHTFNRVRSVHNTKSLHIDTTKVSRFANFSRKFWTSCSIILVVIFMLYCFFCLLYICIYLFFLFYYHSYPYFWYYLSLSTYDSQNGYHISSRQVPFMPFFLLVRWSLTHVLGSGAAQVVTNWGQRTHSMLLQHTEHISSSVVAIPSHKAYLQCLMQIILWLSISI